MADAQSIFKNLFKSYETSLKASSLDKDNEVFLCNDESIDVYDFDRIKEELYPLKHPSSYDALLIDNHQIFCIEFKNKKYSDIANSDIKKKLKNGKEILVDIFSQHNINLSEYNFIYCVAYKNTSARWTRGISKNSIQFELEEFKGSYFDEIFTNDIAFFTNEYKKYFKSSLIC